MARLFAIEDAIQVAFERALGAWSRRGIPDEPSAWLTRVAVNQMLDQLRREKVADARADAHTPLQTDAHWARLDDGVEEALALLFSCADERLAPRVRLVLCLKLLSGFSTEEIAARLFLAPANVQKMLERGRKRLVELTSREAPPQADHANQRLHTVQQVLYLQFNEGYSLGFEEDRLRTELCEEAIRLTRMLATHEQGNQPLTWAMLALMHLHAARLPARMSEAGELVPLEYQDRKKWDQRHIQLGISAFRTATQKDSFSCYHGEAAIQLEHILAPSFVATRFDEIVELYLTLERMKPSPVYALNRVIALAEVKGARAALEHLESDTFPAWFRSHYLYQATVGEMLLRTGEHAGARTHLLRAAESAPSRPESAFFRKCAEGAPLSLGNPLPG